MAVSLKRLLVGRPIATAQAEHERLNKKTALAVFSSDAISSVAYSTEAILLVLLAAGAIAFQYLVPIVVGLSILLAILTLSYRQTIHAYPSGGGAYIVAKDNLGTFAGLVAAASLLVDYILTVSVSVSAGIKAISSALQNTQFEYLQSHRVLLCLVAVGFIAIVNLRGVRESGAIFAGPTYLFIGSLLLLVGVGFFQYLTTGATIPAPAEVYSDAEVGRIASHELSGFVVVWLVMRAFAAGCTALTGVEAISNGVPAFQKSESKNAATTLSWMAIVMTALILGTGLLAYKLQAHPSPDESLLSIMARFTFGHGVLYGIIQISTFAILVLAANTSFADFPRLASLLAADRFLPRQLTNRGDRLVFSNGIVLLAIFASALIVIFDGEEQSMLPLYALGVFISFTLSQSGMVVHWLRERRSEDAERTIRAEELSLRPVYADDPGAARHERVRLAAIERDKGGRWLTSTIINLTGACITGVVGVIIALTKFTHGAWAVVILIPLIVWMFRAINRHYRTVATELRLDGAAPLPHMKHRVIVPISGIHRGVLPALQYAASLGDNAHVTGVYVDTNPETTADVRRDWDIWGMDISLEILESPYRSIVNTLVEYITDEEGRHPDSILTVVLPEFVPKAWWQQLLHNQTALLIKGRLLFEPSVVVTSVPHHLKR